MNIKNIFNTYFKYQPEEHYQFSIPDTEDTSNKNNVVSKTNEQVNVFSSLSVNLEYMKTKYNTMINSDIILRQFTINARGKQYDAFIVYIDGMSDSQLIDDFILKPLMLRNRNNLFDGPQNKIISEAVANNITVRKVKKFDLSNYLMGCLMPQNAVNELTDFDEIAARNKFTETVLFLLKLYLLHLI